jgi:iduronate 2-sulfatase
MNGSHLSLFALSFVVSLNPVAPAAEARRPSDVRKMNVLFLAVDDLRPQLGCYGVTDIRTPHIDKLASEGLLFTRAYCQQAVCSPSRTSLLTGRRPDTTRVYDLIKHFRDTIPDVVTLPQHFKDNGWFCQSFGKIYHGGLDDPKSWSAPSMFSGAVVSFHGPGGSSQLAMVDLDFFTEGGAVQALSDAPSTPVLLAAAAGARRGRAAARAANRPNKPPWSSPDVPDNALGDGKVADAAIEVMNQVKDKPFFLAVGFRKPHLAFDAPKRYYDLYEVEKMRLARNPFPPKDVFLPAMSSWGELRSYKDMPKEGPVSDQTARELIRGYYAATSYTDAQIGRVLAELEKLGLRKNTIVILWGDHGWQLGEHGMWCKHTNFETSTRSMLMISVPGQKTRGSKTDALVEFVDIYPTLCELAGLPPTPGLEGTSFAPVIQDPKRPWKKAAFSQYPRPKLMGYAMRTERYRYVEWVDPSSRKVEGRELYDHQNDPDENVNLANQPEQVVNVGEQAAMLKAGWKAAKP